MAWRELAALFPDLATDRVARWVGECRVHAPLSLPEHRRWSLLSSRLPRALDEHPEWFERLRRAAGQVRDHGGCLVAVEGTAPCRFVLHAARRFALPALLVRFAAPPPQAAVASAAVASAADQRVAEDRVADQRVAEDRVADQGVADVRGAHESARGNSAGGELGGDPVELWVQAPATVDRDRESMTPSTGADSVPLRDRLLWLLGQELRVLAVRRGGSVERLIAAQQRESPGWQPLRFDIPVADTSQRPPAVRVTTTPADSEWPRAPLSPDPRSAEGWISAPVVGSDASEPLPWPMLWHATRRHEGPWAGQGESEFLDELLFERPERDRSALATLRRIIGERRLRASPWALRGSVPSVCFSAAPLHQRPAMRTFRAHRGRWDAEPFGIAIRAELLAQLGARPVIYGDDAVWESLSAPDRPWFQRQSTRGGKSAIDWTGEQEWRLLGDLLLADLPRDSVRVFVPDMATAARVAGESPWPVLALDTLVRADGR